MSYLKDSFEELKKVSWPSKKHAINITIFTIVFTFVATIIITFVDKGLNMGFRYLLELSPKAQPQIENAFDPSQIQITGEDGQPIEGLTIEGAETSTEEN